ncbi:DUF2877 domain-containing protein [Nostocoides sp. F2B08]|uniref:oxamate carbamoyltransferase subunit AllH family protein n=1 Tax=Nostocoides sp. F2B08 TaxID=2653936 RepID=UPI0012639162|nr:DUF2877 domain-containing protein [Tetrasphaera sp. F2B08]KAB7743651.1 DUF2877 domain-containing protein [Tetrasphaera sp. F2B08]
MTASAPIRGAVSSLSAALVHGPVREARVAARTRLGVYLLLDRDGEARTTDVLPVVTSDALALPIALRLPVTSATVRWPVEQGETVSVGGGSVCASGLLVEAVRTVRPARVRRAWQPRTERRGSPGCAAHTPSSMTRLIGRLGSGPGLTPEADDELAGHLLVRWALGGCVPDLEPHLHRTTALSAALLRAAAQGYAVPEVVEYVDAVVGGDRDGALRLRPRVAAIGHTSGPALLRGIHAALYAPPSHPSVERTVA